MVQQRDPLVEAVLRLGKATDFRQPGEGGAAATRAQVTRHLRPQNREAVNTLVSVFHGAEDAQRVRAAAARARETGARTPADIARFHRIQAATRLLEARKARLREQDLAQDQLASQIKLQLSTSLEEQAKLARIQQEHQQQKERAAYLVQLDRGRRLRPTLEGLTQHQRQQIQAVRSRMSGDADMSTDAATMERLGHLCGQVQQELWMQLNAASMAAASAATMPSALMLTNGGDMGSDPFGNAICEPLGCPGAHSQADLEPHLHLPRGSQLQRQVAGLLLLPPHQLAAAVCQLAKISRNGLSVLLGGWDLLADARRRCQALGAAVDPLYDIRKMQQAQVDGALELRRLESQVRAAKAWLLELAMQPAVKQALSRPLVQARVEVEGRRVALAAARASLEGLRRGAVAQGELVEEVGRLEAAAFELEHEERRLEGLVSLLSNALGRVLTEWQQQYTINQEFVQRMLPKSYGELIELAGRSTDRLSRCVAELMRVPAELLPVLAEQRRMQRLEGTGAAGGGGSGTGDGSGSTLGARGSGLMYGLQSPTSLPLVERLRLALPYVGPQRSAAMLRASAASGASAYLGVASTHGSLLLRSSAASTSSSQGAGAVSSSLGDGSSSGLLGLNMSMGSGGVSSSSCGLGAWPHLSSVTSGSVTLSTVAGSWSSSGPGQSLGAGAPGSAGPLGGGSGGSGSWLLSGSAGMGAMSAPAVAWAPGPAALGLPTLCYWVAAAAALDPLSPLRCPAALLWELHERFRSHEQAARWLAAAEAQLRTRQRELAALRPANAALRERLEAKRQADTTERLAKLARSRREMLKSVEVCEPRVRRAMREMEELGAVRLVPWRRVNGLTAAEILEEIRSIFARINQLQQQPLQHQQKQHDRGFGGLMPPPAWPGF
ncbi:hypothetical protein Agub_g3301 [Astrephomene gubernaculifera]|uniref:Uncharacterized protein n=1 Tax=Astrephomene gubernaculifera TaxID=47775 RepID=A0AAD3HIF4_9CHLO|nr:hypothetical protein Agub_g3301 [Astrephomene gubernaculifera]